MTVGAKIIYLVSVPFYLFGLSKYFVATAQLEIGHREHLAGQRRQLPSQHGD